MSSAAFPTPLPDVQPCALEVIPLSLGDAPLLCDRGDSPLVGARGDGPLPGDRGDGPLLGACGYDPLPGDRGDGPVVGARIDSALNPLVLIDGLIGEYG